MFVATPRNVALFIGLCAMSLVFLCLSVIYYVQTSYFVQMKASICVIAVLLATLVFVSLAAYLSIQYFLNKKLQLIYTAITTHRTNDNLTANLNYSTDVLSQVNNDVQAYQQRINTEIAALETNANYRQEFLGNVSHELRTPLFTLQGYILTLIDGGIDDKEIHIKYLHRAQKNVERLINMVEDLQMITELEHNNAHINLQKHNLTDIISEVFASLEIEAKQLNVHLQNADKKPMYVVCDKKKTEQIFINLIMNAIKYSKPEGGIISISTQHLHDKYLIEIADNGIGIAEQHLLRLFERFYRVDSHRARTQGGSGLGLAIVKHCIEAHKQHIAVRSTIGVGTTFSFTLNKG
jgi:two-component system, OmpR family, phosphate regulon sensor histidine kinase PhoR